MAKKIDNVYPKGQIDVYSSQNDPNSITNQASLGLGNQADLVINAEQYKPNNDKKKKK